MGLEDVCRQIVLKIFLKNAMQKGTDRQKTLGVGEGGTVLIFKIEGHAFFEAFMFWWRSSFTTFSYDNWYNLDHVNVLNSSEVSLLV